MDHAATDVDLDTLDIRATVPRPHLRLLHRGPPRHRQPRRDRRGQRDVRDRLPALRLDLARLHRHRPRRSSPTSRRRCSTSSCGATPSGSTGSRRPSRRSSPARDGGLHASRSTVDRDACIGSGICVVYAPGTFTQDAEAKAVVLDGPTDDLDTVRTAVEACPTRALQLVDEPRRAEEAPMAAEGQERDRHRRRLRRRPGLAPSASPRRAPRSCAPTSTSTAPRRPCG